MQEFIVDSFSFPTRFTIITLNSGDSAEGSSYTLFPRPRTTRRRQRGVEDRLLEGETFKDSTGPQNLESPESSSGGGVAGEVTGLRPCVSD